jgi:hypothetical protein
MPQEYQNQGVDHFKAECTKIEGAGSFDAQLTLRRLVLRMAIVAAGLDQCYRQLTKFLRVRQSRAPLLYRVYYLLRVR